MQLSDTNASTLYGITQDIYYLSKTSPASIATGDMYRIVNKYYLQLQEAVRSVNENFYLIVAATNLVIGDGSYTFPNGAGGSAPAYEKIRSIWAAFSPANTSAPLDTEYYKVICVDADAISDPAYIFSTPTAIIFGDYFVLKPLVTSTTLYPVINGVKIYYIGENNLLVNPTDVPVIFPSFHDAITQGSLIDVAERIGNTQLKNDSIKLFKKRLEDIQSYASARIPDESSIVEGQDAQGGWAYPWGNNSMS